MIETTKPEKTPEPIIVARDNPHFLSAPRLVEDITEYGPYKIGQAIFTHWCEFTGSNARATYFFDSVSGQWVLGANWKTRS